MFKVNNKDTRKTPEISSFVLEFLVRSANDLHDSNI